MPSGRDVIVTDTVGFIRDLPKDLFAAFRATFDETQDADLLLHVVDASDPCRDEHVDDPVRRHLLLDPGAVLPRWARQLEPVRDDPDVRWRGGRRAGRGHDTSADVRG